MNRTIHCLFSGGRDSAVACTIAKRVADVKGWGFKLIHIDTGVQLPGVEDYVRHYADWLRAELVVLHAKVDYWEGVRKWGYPLLWHNRWCIEWLKQRPFYEYAEENIRLSDLVVMGIRQGESLFRLNEFTKTFYVHCHRKYGTCIRYWLPVLHAGANTLNMLIRKFNIPTSPIWQKVGISGECMCMAGTPKNTLIRIIRNYPDYARYMAERDREVQESRYSGKPAYPAPLYRDKITLHEFVEKVLKESFITDYIEYEGKPCQGACIIGISGE